MSKKVILLGPLPPPYGGVSVYMSALYAHLKADGVRMWALHGNEGDRDEQTTPIRHRRLGIIPALIRRGRGARILDTTHFHLEYPNKILLPIWLITVINVITSVRKGAVAGPDPWKANTLEWYTTSPPPEHNFDVIPRIRSVEPMKDLRRQIEQETQTEQRHAPSRALAEA